jgi:hypothetical protein
MVTDWRGHGAWWTPSVATYGVVEIKDLTRSWSIPTTYHGPGLAHFYEKRGGELKGSKGKET